MAEFSEVMRQFQLSHVEFVPAAELEMLHMMYGDKLKVFG